MSKRSDGVCPAEKMNGVAKEMKILTLHNISSIVMRLGEGSSVKMTLQSRYQPEGHDRLLTKE